MKIKLIFIFCLLIFLLSACSTTDADSKNTDSIKNYNVYERAVESNEPDEFSIAMANDPISKKMNDELLNKEFSGTADAQAFYDGYLKIWQEELHFSIINLYKYLSMGEQASFDYLQASWEVYVKSSNKFDESLIEKNEIMLGSQYSSSALMYMIEQYRERAIHIKYTTYLLENCAADPVPKDEQMWNKFHDFD